MALPTYESTISYSYDAGDRLILAVDSVTGTISRTYDGLNRLTSEVTPQGSVSYAYDAAGRRTSMSVSGQTAITYGFDNANRLTQISQGSANVSFGYDTDSRRTSLTLANSLTLNYGYDAASQLTGITYTLGSNTLGNLTYAYDLPGRRTGVGGSYARTGTPQAAPLASYNVNNQLTQWKGATLTYDANGNLTSDGTNTYTWNARNQLVSISGGVSASFQYDPFGRRVSKTIGGMTQYLYDGVNPVQEISGTTASANLLTGDVDEYFQRTDSAGARNFLTDTLGSTLALADSTGVVQTQYTFEPFGNTSVTGTATTNSFAFTGRELDATGLYFYRARYYSPTMQRFLAEDAIGFDGGVNLYAYVNQNPIGLRDPFGLQSSGTDTDLYPSPLPIWQEPQGNPGFFQLNINVIFGTVALTRDDFGNWYLSPGLNFGKTIPTIASGSVVRGGFLSGDPVSEAKACSVLKKFSANASAGFIPGGGVSYTPDFGASSWGVGDPSNWTLQAGIFSPQVGVGGTWGFYLGNDMGGRGCGCNNY